MSSLNLSCLLIQIGTLFFSYPDRLVRILWDRNDANGEYSAWVLAIFVCFYVFVACMFHMAALPGGKLSPSTLLSPHG